MRFAIPFLAFALAACAGTPPATTPAATTTAATPTAPARVPNILANAGRDNAPTLEAVTRAFGEADIARRDGAGAALTYRMDRCALLLIFTADARNAMRLAEANPGPRRPGEAAPSLDDCASEARTRSGARR